MYINYILLDICDTTVNFQTADKFIEFVINYKYPSKKIKLKLLDKSRKNIFGYLVFRKLKISYKLKALEYLSGISYEELDYLAQKYFKEYLKPSYNLNVIRFLEAYNNAEIIIVSGGFDIYIKYIAQDIGAKAYIASSLEFKNGHFTGRLKGVDCMGINKVIKLSEVGFLETLDFAKTAVLSDSISDMPLFSLGKYKIAVNPDKELSKLIGKGWVSLDEILNNQG